MYSGAMDAILRKRVSSSSLPIPPTACGEYGIPRAETRSPTPGSYVHQADENHSQIVVKGTLARTARGPHIADRDERTSNPNRRNGLMQNPKEKAMPQTSVVASCTVTDCKFNEGHECHAGSIEVRVSGNGAECGTYSPEGNTRPRP